LIVQVCDEILAAVGFGGAGGYLEMNVYKPLMIFNIVHSITIMADGCTNFRKFLVEGTKPNLKKINEYVDRSLMLVTALRPSSATTRPRKSRITRSKTTLR
jgi:fumarate hydratase class II